MASREINRRLDSKSIINISCTYKDLNPGRDERQLAVIGNAADFWAGHIGRCHSVQRVLGQNPSFKFSIPLELPT